MRVGRGDRPENEPENEREPGQNQDRTRAEPGVMACSCQRVLMRPGERLFLGGSVPSTLLSRPFSPPGQSRAPRRWCDATAPIRAGLRRFAAIAPDGALRLHPAPSLKRPERRRDGASQREEPTTTGGARRRRRAQGAGGLPPTVGMPPDPCGVYRRRLGERGLPVDVGGDVAARGLSAVSRDRVPQPSGYAAAAPITGGAAAMSRMDEEVALWFTYPVPAG